MPPVAGKKYKAVPVEVRGKGSVCVEIDTVMGKQVYGDLSRVWVAVVKSHHSQLLATKKSVAEGSAETLLSLFGLP